MRAPHSFLNKAVSVLALRYCSCCSPHSLQAVVGTVLAASEGCKMLWFVGFHYGNEACNKKGMVLKNMYSATLNSAILNACTHHSNPS